MSGGSPAFLNPRPGLERRTDRYNCGLPAERPSIRAAAQALIGGAAVSMRLRHATKPLATRRLILDHHAVAVIGASPNDTARKRLARFAPYAALGLIGFRAHASSRSRSGSCIAGGRMSIRLRLTGTKAAAAVAAIVMGHVATAHCSRSGQAALTARNRPSSACASTTSTPIPSPHVGSRRSAAAAVRQFRRHLRPRSSSPSIPYATTLRLPAGPAVALRRFERRANSVGRRRVNEPDPRSSQKPPSGRSTAFAANRRGNCRAAPRRACRPFRRSRRRLPGAPPQQTAMSSRRETGFGGTPEPSRRRHYIGRPADDHHENHADLTHADDADCTTTQATTTTPTRRPLLRPRPTTTETDTTPPTPPFVGASVRDSRPLDHERPLDVPIHAVNMAPGARSVETTATTTRNHSPWRARGRTPNQLWQAPAPRSRGAGH